MTVFVAIVVLFVLSDQTEAARRRRNCIFIDNVGNGKIDLNIKEKYVRPRRPCNKYVTVKG